MLTFNKTVKFPNVSCLFFQNGLALPRHHNLQQQSMYAFSCTFRTNLPFPAITICNNNPYVLSRLEDSNDTELYAYLDAVSLFRIFLPVCFNEPHELFPKKAVPRQIATGLGIFRKFILAWRFSQIEELFFDNFLIFLINIEYNYLKTDYTCLQLYN